ncbi:Uncharacterised protein g4774 [Pycnogonum litorale]
MMDVIIDNIPPINGPLEAGIAVGIDPSLCDDEKLIIRTINDDKTLTNFMSSKSVALRFAYTKFSKDPLLTKYYVNSANLLYDCALHSPGDSDAVYGNVGGAYISDTSNDAAIRDMLDDKYAEICLFLIIATKANFWLTNHHTGQSAIMGYARKVLVALLKLDAKSTVPKSHVTMMHTIGHWSATKIILAGAKIPNLTVKQCPFPNITEWVLSAESAIRVASPPAGTHKLALARSLTIRIIKSRCILFFPMPEDLVIIGSEYDKMLTFRALCHVGALFLTGKPRVTTYDNIGETDLGRLGTYGRIMLPHSTLVKSPSLKESLVESYEDFSIDFKQILIGIQSMSIEEARKNLNNLKGREYGITPEICSQLASSFHVSSVYGSAVDEIESDHEEEPKKKKRRVPDEPPMSLRKRADKV